MVFKNVSKHANLFEMIDLLHVPEVNRLMAEKIAEFRQGELGKHLHEQNRKRDYYFREMFVKCRGQDKDMPLYWFELTLYEGLDWRMTQIIPFPPFYTQPYEVLPRDVIQEIAGAVVDPEHILSKEALRSEALNKTVSVRWVRLSGEFICGTVIPGPGPRKENKPEPEDTRLEGDMTMAYRIFLNNLRQFSQPTVEYIASFIKKKLPLLFAGQEKREEKD